MAFKLSFSMSSLLIIVIIFIITNTAFTDKQIINYVNMNRLIKEMPSLLNVSLPEKKLSNHSDLNTLYINHSNAYVFGKNVLYHLVLEKDNQNIVNFKIINQVNIQSSSSDNCTVADSERACSCSKDNIVTSVISQNDHIIACGSRAQGKCFKFKKSNITYNSPFFVSSKTNFPSEVVSSTKSSVIFYGRLRKTNVFYVGFENDCERPFDSRDDGTLPGVPFISARSLSTDSMRYSLQNTNFVSKLEFHARNRNLINSQFLYGFDGTDYAYFITIRSNLKILETRIGRVCHDDPLFSAYTEIPLVCGSDTYASSVTHFDDLTLGKSLLISFNSFGSKHENSSVCLFSLEAIDKAFISATSNCFESGTNSKLLNEFYGQENNNCANMDFNNIDDFLCTRITNRYILGEIPLQTEPFFVLQKDRIVSIAATNDPLSRKNKRFILLLTTKRSSILRLDIEHVNDNLKANEVFVKTYNSPNMFKFSHPVYDDETISFYLLTKTSIVQVPIGTCSIYTSCKNCNHQAKECLWYNSKCHNRNDVPNDDRKLVCPPEIYSYSPTSGPLEGGTILTLHGLNFGPSITNGFKNNNHISITVGDRICIVQERNNELIKCQIEDKIIYDFSTKAFHVDVDVTYEVDLIEFGYDIRGKVSSSELFYFKNPEVRGIFPSYGPFAGGSKIMVYGKNLDIGTNFFVFFGESNCSIVFRSESYAVCRTESFRSTQINVDPMQISVLIDKSKIILNDNSEILISHDGRKNMNYTRNEENGEFYFGNTINQFFAQKSQLKLGASFQYLPNPSVKIAENLNTVLSAGTIMRFRGSYLGSSLFPIMTINHENTPSGRILCKPVANQTELECPFNKSSMLGNLLSLVGKKLTYRLYFDDHIEGDNRDFYIYPNPVFDRFNTTKIVSLEDKIVEFSGHNLHVDIPYNIEMISPQNETIKCEQYRSTIESKNSRLWCILATEKDMLNKIEGSNLQVKVYVGKHLQWNLGSVRFESEHLSAMTIFLVILFILTFMFIVVYIIYLQYPQCSRRDQLLPQNDIEMIQTKWKFDLETIFVRNSTDSKNFSLFFNNLDERHMIINPKHLELDNMLGNGFFGIVHRAFYSPTSDVNNRILVAIKQQKDCQGTAFHDFISEAEIMKDFNHINIMYMIGITLFEDKPAIILPYMNGQDLKKFVMNTQPTVRDLLNYGIQIANGMTYLSELNHVHRDLALRNCMINVDENTGEAIVKVADFGLARKFSQNYAVYMQVTERTLPIKWTAPEAMEFQHFSIKSDVYSYGVTLWELMTRGETPFEYVSAQDLLIELKRGRRLPRPEYCPDLIYIIMCQCWTEPRDRPSFAQLHNNLVESVKALQDLENKSLHSYVNSYFFKNINQNSNQIFDYNDPNAREMIIHTRDEILQSKIGIVFDPSLEFDDTSCKDLENEEPPPYSDATSMPSEGFKPTNGFLNINNASAPPLTYKEY